MKRKILSILVVFFFLIPQCWGANVYVKKIDGTLYYDATATSCEDVTSGDSTGKLTNAIAATGAGDTCYVCAGTYSDTERGYTAISTNRTIEGVGAAGDVIFDGTGAPNGIIDVTGSSFTLRNITLQNVAAGYKALRIPNTSGGEITVLVDICIFQNNTGMSGVAFGAGSAIWAASANKINLNIVDTKFLNNEARRGGAIYINNNVAMTISETAPGLSVFNGNTTELAAADPGGAIYALTCLNTTNISDTDFIGNKSDGDGGAIRAETANLNLMNNYFYGNESNRSLVDIWTAGGAVYVSDAANNSSDIIFNLYGNIFTHNTNNPVAPSFDSDGGAVRVWGVDADDRVLVTSVRNIYQDNWSNIGAGFHASRNTYCTHLYDKFINNKAYYRGAGYERGGENAASEGIAFSMFIGCDFNGNRSGVLRDGSVVDGVNSQGAAVTIRTYPGAEFNGCSFSNNAAVATGGVNHGDSIYHDDEGLGFDGDGGTSDNDRRVSIIGSSFSGSGSNYEVEDSGNGTSTDESGFLDLKFNKAESGEIAGHSITDLENDVDKAGLPKTRGKVIGFWPGFMMGQ